MNSQKYSKLQTGKDTPVPVSFHDFIPAIPSLKNFFFITLSLATAYYTSYLQTLRVYRLHLLFGILFIVAFVYLNYGMPLLGRGSLRNRTESWRQVALREVQFGALTMVGWFITGVYANALRNGNIFLSFLIQLIFLLGLTNLLSLL